MDALDFGMRLIGKISDDVKSLGERAKAFRDKGEEQMATEITMVGAAMINVASAISKVIDDYVEEARAAEQATEKEADAAAS